MFADLFKAIDRYRARTRAAAELERMTDYRLRDIGLTRDQISSFVSGRR